MADKTAGDLAKEGFDFLEAGRYEQAAERYQAAIALGIPEEHWAAPMIHGEYGCVLSHLGDHPKTQRQLEYVLHLERSQSADEASPGTGVARYFLGEHLLRTSQPAQALEVVNPTIEAMGSSATLALVVAAEALHQLGRQEEAAVAALQALESSTSADQKERLRERL